MVARERSSFPSFFFFLRWSFRAVELQLGFHAWLTERWRQRENWRRREARREKREDRSSSVWLLLTTKLGSAVYSTTGTPLSPPFLTYQTCGKASSCLPWSCYLFSACRWPLSHRRRREQSSSITHQHKHYHHCHPQQHHNHPMLWKKNRNQPLHKPNKF